MKRYLLFSCCDYYPLGGVNDLKGCFTKEEILHLLKNNLNELDDDYVNIFDLKTMTPVLNPDEDYGDDEGCLYEDFNFSLDEDYGDIEKLIEIIKSRN